MEGTRRFHPLTGRFLSSPCHDEGSYNHPPQELYESCPPEESEVTNVARSYHARGGAHGPVVSGYRRQVGKSEDTLGTQDLSRGGGGGGLHQDQPEILGPGLESDVPQGTSSVP